MRWRNLIIGIAIVLLAVGAVVMNQTGGKSEDNVETVSSPIKPERDVKVQEGFAAPDFTLTALSGEKRRLYDNKGKPTLINFWASWCGPCKVEMPHLQAAYEKYGDQVNFFMVNLTAGDNMENMEKYIKENNYTFPILLDKEGDVGGDYQVVAIPTTIIVDEKGVIKFKIQGTMSKNQITSLMKELVS